MRLTEFIIASAIIEITPGPNMSYLAGVAITRGMRPALKTVAGIMTALALVGLLVACGVADFLEHYIYFQSFLRWSGICFMLFLAHEAWHGRHETAVASRKTPGDFNRGLITNLLNPKIYIFYLTVLPDFIDTKSPDLLSQNLLLVTIYVAVATVAHSGIAVLSNSVRKYVRDKNKVLMQRGMALLLVGVAIWIFIGTIPEMAR